MPTMVQAGVYSSVLHYLKAVEATAGKDSTAVMAKMKETPSEDPLFGKGEILANGRHIHDMYLFRVKAPDASKGEWDYYEQIATIPAAEAFKGLAILVVVSGCGVAAVNALVVFGDQVLVVDAALETLRCLR